MMSPRDAIDKGNVWVRPFGHFAPVEQGFMGFSSRQIRDDRLVDIGAGGLVFVWIKSKGEETSWRGRFRGIIQLTDTVGSAGAFSSSKGAELHRDSEADFGFAIQVQRAWVADPAHPVEMKSVIPATWAKKKFLAIGSRAEKMDASEVGNIEGLRVKEVQVFGHSAPTASKFDIVRNVLK